MITDREFFTRDCLTVAQDLVGKLITCKKSDGTAVTLRISETEAYCGEDDTACHASRSRTPRTEVFYMNGGTVYVYLCYGMHWMLNIVTGAIEQPEAVLIRACVEANGPGKLTKKLGVTGTFNKCDIIENGELFIEDDGKRYETTTAKRVGIDYAAPVDRDRLWRFCIGNEITP